MKAQRFFHEPPAPTHAQPPSLSTSFRKAHSLQPANLHSHAIATQSPQFTTGPSWCCVFCGLGHTDEDTCPSSRYHTEGLTALNMLQASRPCPPFSSKPLAATGPGSTEIKAEKRPAGQTSMRDTRRFCSGLVRRGDVHPGRSLQNVQTLRQRSPPPHAGVNFHIAPLIIIVIIFSSVRLQVA